MKIERVDGEYKGNIMLYALSTCSWCKKTKNLLSDKGIKFSYVYVDLLKDDEKENVMNELKKWNPRCSFPTMVINNKKVIVGFKEEEINEALYND
jgi:glutaredoxin